MVLRYHFILVYLIPQFHGLLFHWLIFGLVSNYSELPVEAPMAMAMVLV